MLLRCTRTLLKQTKNPPKRFVPIDQNPLARWSKELPKWSDIPPRMPSTGVGLEGCNSAFNATNSIRTCLFFGTSAPPCFLSVKRWADIEHVQTRAEDSRPATVSEIPTCGDFDRQALSADAASRHFHGAEMKDLARFGEDAFLLPAPGDAGCLPPLVAVENFTRRSQSIFRCRFPAGGWRMVVGHENWGVRSEFIDGTVQQGDNRPRVATSVPAEPSALRAEMVLYVPQYGTISSLNVVTSLGVALFYAFLDRCFPASRTLVTDVVSVDPATVGDGSGAQSAANAESLTVADLVHFQRQFMSPVPVPETPDTSTTPTHELPCSTDSAQPAHRNTSPRLDARPIHPRYYHRDKSSIRQRHQDHRNALLAFSRPQACDNGPGAGQFGLSVLYENDFDQRNFGGLIRNANGFLVDHIFYVGRRKFNVVGAVGSNHYTPPEYLGPCCESGSADEAESCAVERWSNALRLGVEDACRGKPLRWWLLDLGHARLYAEGQSAETAGATGEVDAPARTSGSTNQPNYYSSAASIRWYQEHVVDPNTVLTLCDTEEVLAAAARDGVLLVVPQEGKLPHIGILRQCESILCVIPPSHSAHSPAGLPSQVASGIALQRLSTVMHPRLRLLS